MGIPDRVQAKKTIVDFLARDRVGEQALAVLQGGGQPIPFRQPGIGWGILHRFRRIRVIKDLAGGALHRQPVVGGAAETRPRRQAEVGPEGAFHLGQGNHGVGGSVSPIPRAFRIAAVGFVAGQGDRQARAHAGQGGSGPAPALRRRAPGAAESKPELHT